MSQSNYGLVRSFECIELKIFHYLYASDCKIDIGLNDMMREFLVEQENFFATKAKKEIQ